MATQRFRKRPVVIEAVQWTGDNVAEVTAFLNGGGRFAFAGVEITTIHGEAALARTGDWIAREPMPGRFYPIKPDIFAASYESVEDEPK